MAKLIEFDVSGVEESGGTGVKVKPGLKVARIVSVTKRDTKSDGSPANDLQVVLDVGEEFDWLYTYIGLGPSSDWKLKEFTKAVGLGPKGKFDPDKLKDKIIRVKVNSGEFDGEYSPNAGKLFPPQPGDTVGNASFSSNDGAAAGPDEEPDGDSDAVSEIGGTFEPTREDPNDPEVGSYDDWSDEDIAAEVEDRGLTLPGGRGTARNKGLKALRADDEAQDAEPEPAAEAAEGGDGDDYDEWSTEDLVSEWNAREMGDVPVVRGRNAEARQRGTIIAALKEDDEENPFQG